MHGELSVSSEVGRGSTFTLTLPRASGAGSMAHNVKGMESRAEAIV
jgi:hypothetical protein